MSVTASAAVLITTCTTQPGSEVHQQETARLAKARKTFADTMAQARGAVP